MSLEKLLGEDRQTEVSHYTQCVIAGFFYVGNKTTKEILEGRQNLFLWEYFPDRKLCENGKMLELCDISNFFFNYGDYCFSCGNV